MYLITFGNQTILTSDMPVVQDASDVKVEIKISTLISAARTLYEGGHKIDAIRLVRAFVPDLKEAKDFVEESFEPKIGPLAA